jgi:hypothetical protein
MSTTTTTSTFHRRAPRSLPAGLKRLINEASELLAALSRPGRLIAEVEQMGDLYRQAARLESSDPVQAEQLRARAARIGSRLGE